MARAVLASELLSRLRQCTDTENDGHVTDAELYRQLTMAVAETWDFILNHGLGGEYVKSATFSTVAGTQEYLLTTIASDFYKVKTLYVNEGNGQYRPISRVNPNEEYGMKAPAGIFSMKLYYIPCAPTWTLGSESFDGINGWEEHVIQTAAIAVKKKKQDDVSQYRATKREIEERIKASANRNQDEAPRVVRRKRAQQTAALWAPYSPNVTNWDIRGLNLELFYSYGVYAQ